MQQVTHRHAATVDHHFGLRDALGHRANAELFGWHWFDHDAAAVGCLRHADALQAHPVFREGVVLNLVLGVLPHMRLKFFHIRVGQVVGFRPHVLLPVDLCDPVTGHKAVIDHRLQDREAGVLRVEDVVAPVGPRLARRAILALLGQEGERVVRRTDDFE